MSARSLFILAALLALASAASIEAYIVLQQETELDALQKQVVDARRQLTRLREAIRATRAELTASEDQSTRAVGSASAAQDSAVTARESETKAWLARTRRLQGLFATQPGQRIPEMQLLTDEDWLRAGKQASFEDEHSTRLALGRVRGVAKEKFMPQFQSVLRSYQSSSGSGELPPSLAPLASLFDPPVDPAMLERYEITKGQSRNKDRTTFDINERAPVDASYDTRGYVSMDSNGGFSVSVHGAPYAWIPDFKNRMTQAYQAYAAAHKGVPPPLDLSHIVPYFNPPLDTATVELVARFERERRP